MLLGTRKNGGPDEVRPDLQGHLRPKSRSTPFTLIFPKICTGCYFQTGIDVEGSKLLYGCKKGLLILCQQIWKMAICDRNGL